jgi:quinol monooxygenase YgiN
MSQVAVIAKITTQDGKRDDAVAALQPMLHHVETEVGTQRYILHTDSGDANVLWMYEIYTDQEALVAHGASDAMKALGPALGGLLAGRPELTFMTPVGGKGI